MIKNWSDYVDCVNLPEPKSPPELRRYLLKWQQSSKEHYMTDHTWELQTNPRSILNQNFNSVDLTRKTIAKNQPNIGGWYNEKIEHGLKVLNGLHDMLKDGKLNNILLENDLLEVLT